MGDTPSQSVSHLNSPPKEISPHLTLQTPLSRRGRGPGLVLVVDHYAAVEAKEGVLDPSPLRKWAEEGYAVVMVKVPAKSEDGGEFPLERALQVLGECEECVGEEVGVVSYLSRIPFYVEEAACLSPAVKAIISYGGKTLTSINPEARSIAPQLVHIAGPEPPARRESFSVVPEPEAESGSTAPATGPVKSFCYADAKRDSGWVLPADEEYHAPSANIAHTRSLSFLKPLLNGPFFDLEAIWEEHCAHEFATRDVAATMATMVSQPYVNHIPTMTGGIGKERLTAFYTHHFIFANPADTALSLVSRTTGINTVVDEFVFKMTHDKQVDWLLPGIPPTGRFLEIPFVSVVQLRGDRLCHEHIHWDQGSALRQAGLLPEWVRWQGEIEGRKAGSGKKFEVRLPIGGVETSRKLVDEGSVESNALMEGAVREVDDV